MLSWHTISSDGYKAATDVEKTSDKLFFLYDTKEIYKGTELYTESVVLCSAFPEKPAINRLYINSTTFEGKIYDGENWVTAIAIPKDGASAYEIAKAAGFEGTKEEWLESLKGSTGKSAYQYAVDGGYSGTEEDFKNEINPQYLRESITKLSIKTFTEDDVDSSTNTINIRLSPNYNFFVSTCSASNININLGDFNIDEFPAGWVGILTLAAESSISSITVYEQILSESENGFTFNDMISNNTGDKHIIFFKKATTSSIGWFVLGSLPAAEDYTF